MRTRRQLLIAGLVLAGMVFVLFAVFPLAYDSWRVATIRSRAAAIAPGDSQERVRELLGNPIAEFLATLETGTIETWAYGGYLDFSRPLSDSFPYICQIRLRLLIPDDDDVAIKFDEHGTVVRVVIL